MHIFLNEKCERYCVYRGSGDVFRIANYTASESTLQLKICLSKTVS